MHIQSLRNFYDIATLKSISKVASQSHISQSALSQQILKLEGEFGVPLLERSNKGVELTKEGDLLLKHIKTIIMAYDRITEDISSMKRDKNSFVASSSSSAINSTILKAIISIKDKYRNYSFELDTRSSSDILLELDNNLCDVALTYDKIEEDGITSIKIGSSELIFVANKELDINKSASVDEILKYPFILLSDGPDIKRLLHMALLSKGLNINDLNIVFTANSIDIARNAIYGAQTISLLPKTCVDGPIGTGIIKKFMIPDLSFSFDIFLSYKNENYKQTKETIDDFKKEVRRLLK